MVITDKLKKLEQVNKLMEKRGFFLLGDTTLEEYASDWGNSEYDKYYWDDLHYVKHYGKQAQHSLHIAIGTTKKLFRLYGNLYVSHLDITRAFINLTDIWYLEGNDYQREREHFDRHGLYVVDAKSDIVHLKKALNKVSSYTEE